MSTYGTIKANNLTHSTAGTVSTEYVVEGSAKVWVNFQGDGTLAVRDSLNVSSVTDSGTGDYDTNFTNNMSNDDYAPVGYTNSYPGSNNFYSAGLWALGTTYNSAAGQTTSLINILAWVAGTGASDARLVNKSLHGDLA